MWSLVWDKTKMQSLRSLKDLNPDGWYELFLEVIQQSTMLNQSRSHTALLHFSQQAAAMHAASYDHEYAPAMIHPYAIETLFKDGKHPFDEKKKYYIVLYDIPVLDRVSDFYFPHIYSLVPSVLIVPLSISPP